MFLGPKPGLAWPGLAGPGPPGPSRAGPGPGILLWIPRISVNSARDLLVEVKGVPCTGYIILASADRSEG